MNILFRYMLREYVKIFGMCFAGLMTIYLVIDFFEKVRRFLRYDAHALDVLAYFVLKMPGRLKWGDLSLKRGMTSQMDMWKWRKDVEDGKIDKARKNGSIVMYDYDFKEVDVGIGKLLPCGFLFIFVLLPTFVNKHADGQRQADHGDDV